MIDDVMGAYGSRFFLAAGGVGVALLVLIGILWLMRNRAPSPFVRGGKNRQPRLQVLDAAAVDTRRRLVLVRRDDVEHLIMIGGPTDIVIESRILPDRADNIAATAVAAPAPVMASAPAPAAPPAPVIEARPEPVAERPLLRAVPDAKPEPKPEPKPELKVEPKPEPVYVFEEEEDEPEIYVPAPAPVIEPRQQAVAPVSVIPVAVPQPRPVAPAPAPVAPPVMANPEPRIQPQPQFAPRPMERPAPAPVIETVDAGDILDAARARVLQNRVEPSVSTPPAQSIPTVVDGAPVVTADAGAPPQAPRGEFQRILEEEMNTNLMAERIVPVQNQPVRPAPPQQNSLPRRDPEMAPITGSDAELQREVARIFGEMSVNRDK